ncbi:MAG: hypothetical protein HYV63_34105 [Candidatus Schekmanbacteria bacterium]|nr:hypothetical protein [Candidatus Schekmanbacteria bacterium]
MALPRPSDPIDETIDSLVYLAAKTNANPVTRVVSAEVWAIVDLLERTMAAVRAANRAEVVARAVRDWEDEQGDVKNRDLRRAIGGLVGDRHFVVQRSYPQGIKPEISPRGREQVVRLRDLSTRIGEVLKSPELATDPKVGELTALLNDGRATITSLADHLDQVVKEWTEKLLARGEAADASRFYREEAVAQAGVVLGKLRALLGGSASEALSYTMPSRTRSEPAEEPTPPSGGGTSI